MIKVTKLQIPELPTEKPRRLYVYLPAGYENSGKKYPVIYMFDGHNVFYDSHATYGKSWGMGEYLRRSKKQVILVGVECHPENEGRLSEYSPWDIAAGRFRLTGRGRETMEWFTKTLKPAIDSEYRTLPDREHTMIAGSSMGGLMAVYAAVEYGGVFSRAAALSPTIFLNPKKMAELIAGKSLKNTRIYMDYGSAETEEHPAPWRQMFTLAGRLSKAGAYVAARVVPGALHSEAYWEQRIPVFMDYLTDDWK